MELEDRLRLVVAIRDTADALRQEADYVEDPEEVAFLLRHAESCDRRAAEMERELPTAVGARRSQESFMPGSYLRHNSAR
ncbi:MAG: hypothetical protein MI920_28895 [Kiloniellales bacterium]|nr:hypothetical protein [Kiloniellales bacterium]